MDCSLIEDKLNKLCLYIHEGFEVNILFSLQ